MNIVEYVRDRKNNKTGVLIAKCEGDKVKIGYSKCHKDYDTFNKNFGKNVASDRADKKSDELIYSCKVPFQVIDQLPKFINRCKRYYKDKTFPKWVDLDPKEMKEESHGVWEID